MIDYCVLRNSVEYDSHDAKLANRGVLRAQFNSDTWIDRFVLHFGRMSTYICHKRTLTVIFEFNAKYRSSKYFFSDQRQVYQTFVEMLGMFCLSALGTFQKMRHVMQ